MSEYFEGHLGASSVSRRDLLKRLGITGVAIGAGGAFLAACGDDKGGSDTTAAPGTTSAPGTTAAPATTTGGATTTTGGAPAGDLASMVGVDPANLGGGKEFQIGAVLALTGTGSYYGETMSNGINLAVKQIKAAGGPDIKVTYYDHKSGDAAAGKQAVTEIIAKKIPCKLASYVDDLGAMLADTAANKIFTLDGGGGTSIFGQKQPYFWGTRAITPNDPLPGLFQWWKENNPGKVNVGLCGWDIGEPNNSIIKEDVLKKIADAGLTHNGLYELVPVGNQDFSAVFPKIKGNEPDLLLLGIYGQDPGSFANQAATQGLKASMVGFEFTPDGTNASKGTYDSVGWTFAYDYFEPSAAASPYGKYFVDTFTAEYGKGPDFYAANFYEDTMAIWNTISRVLKAGGDINSGEALDAAWQTNLTFASVYGGDASTNGTFQMDPVTHSVKQRVMGVFTYKGGTVTPHAFFDINGANYKKA